MSEYTYYHFDGGRLLARRKGNNMPELLGGAKCGVWAKYPDIERFDTNVQEISEAQFKKELPKHLAKNPDPLPESTDPE